jgi:hypothetical protein
MEWYLPVIWAGLIGTAVAMYVILDGFDLGVGILFPFARRNRARPDDELGRAVLGRQRDLAGARRRRIVGRVPAGLCHHHAGGLSADHRHAARADLPRRRVRVPRVAQSSKGYWNFAFAGGLDLAAFTQGVVLGGCCRALRCRTASSRAGRSTGSTPFSLLCGVRRRRGLCAAWRDLAHPATEGNGGGRARAIRPRCCCWPCSSLHGGGQPLDAAADRTHRRTLVHAAELPVSVADPDRDGAARLHGLEMAERRARIRALRRHDRPVPARLCSGS